ncbi:DNA gyrase inhibitor YacG [Roseomonas sp. NAR14]|uniref:DNA gyrase inhibitor YacG n=1 Tax=Roseomonas acroporae TaxID=2937791 RepID=A0A9X1YCT6_9PROT|nr:DNA gyrase inhibitor YacG [Roseomonas acroporae]MCK8786347.1 DNA gyrase inhibitor YacG [Roseomonas acroporae]
MSVEKDAKPAARSVRARRCPVCGKPAEAATRPFCSPRCRQVDLGRWLTGAYVVPGEDGEAAPDDFGA